jgi:hypothetical protein
MLKVQVIFVYIHPKSEPGGWKDQNILFILLFLQFAMQSAQKDSCQRFNKIKNYKLHPL